MHTSSRVKRTVSLALMAALGLMLFAGGACDSDTEEGCPGARIAPHQAPIVLGDFYPLGADGQEDLGSNESVPFEWVLQLISDCNDPVKISQVCLIGDDHNGAAGQSAFTIEGPVPDTVPFGETGKIRITFDHTVVNTLDEHTYTPPQSAQDLGEWTMGTPDGVPDPDVAALVIQSNAKNFPTLVIPVCARIVPPGSDKEIRRLCPLLPDELQIAPGTRDETLCP